MKFIVYEILFIILLLFVTNTKERLSHVRCSQEVADKVIEGIAPDIGTYPWLGLIIHTFFIAGKPHQAMASGVLIHPHFALAAAEDMSKILPEALGNSTVFVLYKAKKNKYVLPITDYAIHPEHVAKNTIATLALLELDTDGETGLGENMAPVYPICLPIQGIGTFEELYTVKFTDERGEFEKSITKMKYIEDTDCEEFYYRAQLNDNTHAPIHPLCAAAVNTETPCVWEAGYLLITRQWGFWKLVGFGMRGPGCGAPARFLSINHYMNWIDLMASPRGPEEEWGRRSLYVLRQSPIKLHLYSGSVKFAPNQGQCERNERGQVLYKDSSEILMSKNFGQGFFWLAVIQPAEFLCASVILVSTARTNAALWLEHSCHQSNTGGMRGYINKTLECFVYYTTTAYLEFRFYFSFRAVIEATLFGKKEWPKKIPNVFYPTQQTEPWWPTATIIRWNYFVAYQQMWYNP